MKINNFIKIFAVFLIAILLLNTTAVYALSSSELQELIKQQQEALKKTENDLKQAQNNVKVYTNSLANAQAGIPYFQAEIEKIGSDIQYNNLQMELLDSQKKLKELEKSQKQLEQKKSLVSSYMEWKTTDTELKNVMDTEFSYLKSQEYAGVVLNNQNINILGLSTELDGLQKDIGSYQEKTGDLVKQNEDLKKKKKDLEDQIAWYNSQIAYNSNKAQSLQNSLIGIKSKIDILSVEQRKAQQEEEELLQKYGIGGGGASLGCGGLEDQGNGKIVFCGNGRDLVQGHGVGMSQYGAVAAADMGWKADAILTFYYQGTQVTQYALNSEITIKYCQGNPVNATPSPWSNCGSAGPEVTERVSFDTYLSGIGEMPHSWGFEARKAQMIAARTYAVRYTNNGDPNKPICLTAYCQVSYIKSGGTLESDAVQYTKDLTLTYGGSLAETLYSADNNQGNGTADHDTRFQDFYGNATGNRPYLVSVNDNQFAAQKRLYWNQYCGTTACGLWGWRTNAYTYADMDTFLNFAAGLYNEAKGIRDGVGNVHAIAFQRDPSQRIKKVTISGSNGVKTMGGWWFKYLWNEWVASKATYDFMYSQTTYIYRN